MIHKIDIRYYGILSFTHTLTLTAVHPNSQKLEHGWVVISKIYVMYFYIHVFSLPGTLLQKLFNFNPSMDKITYIIMRGMKLVIDPQTSTVQPLKFGNGQAISFHTLLGVWLLIHTGIEVNSC